MDLVRNLHPIPSLQDVKAANDKLCEEKKGLENTFERWTKENSQLRQIAQQQTSRIQHQTKETARFGLSERHPDILTDAKNRLVTVQRWPWSLVYAPQSQVCIPDTAFHTPRTYIRS